MNKAFSIILLAVLTLACASAAFGKDSVETEVRERVKQYVLAYNAGDADAVAAIYAENGTHTYALGFTHRGRIEISKGLKEQLSGPMKSTRIAITPLHIRVLSADIAVEEASFSLTGLKGPGGAELPPVNGFCLGVYQKMGNQWFAVAVQCMVPPPPPPQSR
jgi:uncharacterized protein (TIGR02246 family)